MPCTVSRITPGQSVDVTARPLGDKAKPVLLRWWLDDRKEGTLYVNGCMATYVAPTSIGTAYEVSVNVLVAREGDRKPYSGDFSGYGYARIYVTDASNALGGRGDCTTVTYSVTVHSNYGPITKVDIQGLGTWHYAGDSTVTISGVPPRAYTVTVTTTGGTLPPIQPLMVCPITRSNIK